MTSVMNYLYTQKKNYIGIYSVNGGFYTDISEELICRLYQASCGVHSNRLIYLIGLEWYLLRLVANLHAKLSLPILWLFTLCVIKKGGETEAYRGQHSKYKCNLCGVPFSIQNHETRRSCRS